MVKILTEGRDRIGWLHWVDLDVRMSKFLKIGRGWARSSFKSGTCIPRTAVNLLVIPFNKFLTTADGAMFPTRSIETGTDFDLSKNTNAHRSFLHARYDQRRGEARRADRQR